MDRIHLLSLPRHRRYARLALAFWCEGNPAAACHIATKQRHMARIAKRKNHENQV
jgi:hypothetical protein